MRPIKLNSSGVFVAIVAVAILVGCGSSTPAPKTDAPPARSALSGMLGRPLLVLPAQYLAIAAPGGRYEISMANRQLLALFDEELADAFRKRGVRSSWMFAQQITEAAMRNGGLVPDPRELSAETIRRLPAGDTPLPEPLGTQIRQLIALQEGRYALVPVEVDVDSRPGYSAGVLRVMLIDARTARIVWVDSIGAPAPADVAGDDLLSGFGFRRLARALATRFAEMVVAQ